MFSKCIGKVQSLLFSVLLKLCVKRLLLLSYFRKYCCFYTRKIEAEGLETTVCIVSFLRVASTQITTKRYLQRKKQDISTGLLAPPRKAKGPYASTKILSDEENNKKQQSIRKHPTFKRLIQVGFSKHACIRVETFAFNLTT